MQVKQDLKRMYKKKLQVQMEEMKKEFEKKFINNENIWKKRMKFHKEMLKQEKQKSEDVIRQLEKLEQRVK